MTDMVRLHWEWIQEGASDLGIKIRIAGRTFCVHPIDPDDGSDRYWTASIDPGAEDYLIPIGGRYLTRTHAMDACARTVGAVAVHSYPLTIAESFDNLRIRMHREIQNARATLAAEETYRINAARRRLGLARS